MCTNGVDGLLLQSHILLISNKDMRVKQTKLRCDGCLSSFSSLVEGLPIDDGTVAKGSGLL